MGDLIYNQLQLSWAGSIIVVPIVEQNGTTLHELCWLRIGFQIQFKMLVMTHELPVLSFGVRRASYRPPPFGESKG